ncbi:MAG: hypothetical protein RI967_1976, partial [Planctomycetota bacterium]
MARPAPYPKEEGTDGPADEIGRFPALRGVLRRTRDASGWMHRPLGIGRGLPERAEKGDEIGPPPLPESERFKDHLSVMAHGRRALER